MFNCEICETTYSRKDTLKRHMESAHSDPAELSYPCGVCKKYFKSVKELREHRAQHKNELEQKDVCGFVETETSHKKKCSVMRYYFPQNIHFVDPALVNIFQPLSRLLELHQSEHGNFKYVLVLNIEFAKISENGEIEAIIIVPFRSNTNKVLYLQDIQPDIIEGFHHITSTIDEFVNRGSGWSVNDILYFDVEIAACKPIAGSCSKHEVRYRRGQGLKFDQEGFNVVGEHDCFYLAVASHFVTSDDQIVPFIKERLKKCVPAPVHLTSITKFEEENSALNMAVNVIYKDENGILYPVRVSTRKHVSNIIVLMLTFVETDNGEGIHHYAYLEEPEKLLAPRVKDRNGKTRTVMAHFCFNCFNHQFSQAAYLSHISWCHAKTGQRIRMPEPEETVFFDNEKKSAKIGYVMFFDFETLQIKPKKSCSCPLEVIEYSRELERAFPEDFPQEKLENIMLDEIFLAQEGKQRNKKMKICPHKSRILYEQHAFSYSIILVDRHGLVLEDKCYVGEDAAHHFIQTLLELETKYTEKIKSGGEPIKESEEGRKIVDNATDCWICGDELGYDRAIDHDHISGEILGVAHNKCNLARKEEIKFVAFAHNFSGYDSHIIVKELGKFKKQIWNIDAIPLNTQKFKKLQINNIILLDSAAFLPDSLEKLVTTLAISDHKFPIVKQRWDNPDHLPLLIRKGVYPYSFATSIDRLAKCIQIPDIKEFRNEIGDAEISQEDYEHAQDVWSMFDCKNMLDYTRLYVTLDVYLLAEAIVELRDSIIDEFELDLCHYLSLPMLAKDIMLKSTKVEMELISDQEMSHLLQSNIRGGLSFINTRLAEAKKEKSAIAYLDANNLYGHAMCHPLPLRDFRWMTEEEIVKFDPHRDINLKNGPGYILEVTLRYPERLHLDHNSFPLAPEQIEITEEDLSPYSLKCMQELDNKKKHRAKKLTATFRDRERYLVHGLNLKLYLELGLELIQIHRGITFYQEKFLKPYIDMCTLKRTLAKTKSAGDRMKLLSNSLYGKMIEGTNKRMDCKFNYDESRALRNFSDPLFKGFLICGENFSVSFHLKKQIYMKQSWAVGYSILEISKFVMQSLMYKYIKPRFNGRISTLMSDTDSFVLYAPLPSPDHIVSRIKKKMDFSNYPSSSSLRDCSHPKRPGYLKNEVPNDTILKFAGVRSKTYAFVTKNNITESKAKGVKRCYKKKIPFQAYVNCLTAIEKTQIEQVGIISKNHQNMLVKQLKVAFSSFDDKRFLLCAIHSVPYGSYLIKTFRETGECYFCKNPDIYV